MRGRTVRSFRCPEDLWSRVDAWAAATGFRLQQQESGRRLYCRGNRLLMAPACLEISREGRQVTLEAWVKADFYLILSLLSGKPAEAGIESGGLTASLPRKRARDAVNRLLADLGQPLIV